MLATLAARDQLDFGDPAITRAHLIDKWASPGFAPESDAVLVEEASADAPPAGFASVFDVGSLAVVHPSEAPQALRPALVEWCEERERALERPLHRQRIAAGDEPAAGLLRQAGYTWARTVWLMVRGVHAGFSSPLERPPAPPAGIRLTSLDPDADALALHAADAAAFAANADYVPETLAGFRAEHLLSPHLDLATSIVARRDGEIAGYALCQRHPPAIGYIDLLGVAEPERGRGLGGAILHRVLERFVATGLREARLEVASDNPPAMRLYERAGLRPRHGSAAWEKPPG